MVLYNAVNDKQDYFSTSVSLVETLNILKLAIPWNLKWHMTEEQENLLQALLRKFRQKL